MSEPNNVIAPYWTPTYIGTGSWVRYTSGGTAPNRYFVVEWHDVKGGDPSDIIGGDDTFRFETILYENGDIVFQYQAMIINGSNSWCGAAGIEDSIGLDGLSYVNFCSQAPSFKAVRFYRPPASARVKLDPAEQGSFAVSGETKNLQVNVLNTGELGSDTYDLFLSTIWPVTFYAANGVTPLTDTDTDGTVDTGPVPQGSTVTITAKVAAPIGAILGSANTATVTARSSLNISKSKTATLQSAVPAPFAQIYEDFADGAMSLELVQPNAQVVKKATTDGYYGYSMAVTAAPNGNFVYVWANGRCLDGPCNIYVNEIEYTLLDQFGNTVRTVSKLIDNSAATMFTYDSSPSVTIAPNGTIGIVWYRYLYNSATSQFNYNIYFATLDGAGNLLSGPTNVTNNAIWGTYSDLNIPRFFNPTIAASDDNRFIMSWRKYIGNPYESNIWYAVRDTAGASVFPPAALTSDNRSWSPVLNSLTGGKAILTWVSNVAPNYGTPTYAVLNSSGAVAKAATTLGVSYVYETPDAVQLPNGKVAVAWPANGGVQYDILNSSYAIESGPNSANSPSFADGYGLSVTTDPSSRVIMTWQDAIAYQKLFYALGDSTGTFITQPMIYKTSASGVDTSYNGQGNAPLKATNVLSIVRASVNPTNLASVDFTATFSQSVTGVDTGDFSLTTTGGVSGATVSGVSGSGSAYTVTVNTGSGDGTIRLDVVDNNSIVDGASNPLGGAVVGDGNFTTGQVYTINKSSIFADVPLTYWANSHIERLYNAGITGGCMTIPLSYCPDRTVTRAQMAVFLMRGIHGSAYVPPAVGASTGFTDVATNYWAAAFIKQLAVEGITGGCGVGLYCPETIVTRSQMAVFLLRAKYTSAYNPPNAIGVFADVPMNYWAAGWIEQLAAEGITAGCGAGIYCPETNVTRAQMAVFLVRTFNLP